MANTLGVRVSGIITAALAFTSNVVLASVGLNPAIAAGQTLHGRWWVPFTVGATGGIRAQILVPAAGVVFLASIKLYNTVAPSLTTATQLASAVFTNAAANAGTHWLEIEATIVNGVTAGTVDLQIAQNTSDVLTLTVLRGGYFDGNKL